MQDIVSSTGDHAIRTIGESLRRAVRASDVCARIGGDEFALLMPETDGSQAEDVVRRIRVALEHANQASGRPLDLSIGLATWEPGLEPDQLFELADSRLYREKEEHRARRRHA